MNIFCYCIKEELFKKFRIEVDIFVSKKKLVHFAFSRPLISYSFFDDIFEFVVCQWEDRRNYFSNYKMIYLHLNHSMRWKHDYIFFEK